MDIVSWPVAGLAACLMFGDLALAQSSDEIDSGDVASARFMEYGYDRMKRFAVAFIVIHDLQNDYDARLLKLEPTSPAYRKLIEQSDAEMSEAIESTGLSVEAYNAIAEAAASDKTLERQIAKLVRSMQRDVPQTESGGDIVDLGTMEVQGYVITKALIDAEVTLALRRPLSLDPEDEYVLICRDSTTGTNIKRRWCAYNGDLVRPQKTDTILTIDPFVMQSRWKRFYDRLPD